MRLLRSEGLRQSVVGLSENECFGKTPALPVRQVSIPINPLLRLLCKCCLHCIIVCKVCISCLLNQSLRQQIDGRGDLTHGYHVMAHKNRGRGQRARYYALCEERHEGTYVVYEGTVTNRCQEGLQEVDEVAILGRQLLL